MTRIYLSKDGKVRSPTAAENSHYGMARSILGPDWKGDTEDAYIAMWNLGWVRVVELDQSVFGERYVNGQPVLWAELTPAQVGWFEDQATHGKKLVWNDAVFESTRENKGCARQAGGLVERALQEPPTAVRVFNGGEPPPQGEG